ncbi:DoxX family protein [Sphingobacterium spiritivorum]|uniref:DoxX family protein n=1 Tax=Sphingobacterium TaxID=28453 RepID=UPI0025FD929A|nr:MULTISPECIES: DoxX family protein [unclassified Sphingobacterium]
MKKSQDIGLFMVRITIAAPMLMYGISKIIHGISYIEGLLTEKGLPAVFAYGVYVGEIIAPLLLIIGFRTRLAGLLFSINCLTAIILAQTAAIFSLNENGGWALETLAIYAGISAALFFTGSGKIALSSAHHWD